MRIRIAVTLYRTCDSPRPCISTSMPGDGHLAGYYGHPLVFAILILRASAWKNAMDAINTCVAFIDGAHGKTRATALKGILSGAMIIIYDDYI